MTNNTKNEENIDEVIIVNVDTLYKEADELKEILKNKYNKDEEINEEETTKLALLVIKLSAWNQITAIKYSNQHNKQLEKRKLLSEKIDEVTYLADQLIITEMVKKRGQEWKEEKEVAEIISKIKEREEEGEAIYK